MKINKKPDLSRWHRTVGLGVRKWAPGDTKITGPTGPMFYPVFYHPDDNIRVRSAISNVNRHRPRIGRRIDPWHYSVMEFLKIGGAVEWYDDNILSHTDYGMYAGDDGDYHYYTYFDEDMGDYTKRGDVRKFRY